MEENKPKHRDIKPLRIIFTVLLSCIAVISFTSFVYLRAGKYALSKNVFADVFSDVNILDAQLGSIAEGISIKGVDSESTVSEAMSVLISETATEEFGYNITSEEVDEILSDPELREDVGNITGDVMSGVIYGELDSDQLADDVEDLIVDNKDMIEDVSGYEISDELIEEVHDKVSEVKTNTGVLSQTGYSVKSYTNFISNTLIYSCLGIAVLCVVGVMLFNMFKLATGVRSVGIASLVSGLSLLVGGLLIKFSPKLLMAMINSYFDVDQSEFFGLFATVIDGYASAVARMILIPSLICGIVGIMCMIGQAVLVEFSKIK